jgi:hypothetical protein
MLSRTLTTLAITLLFLGGSPQASRPTARTQSATPEQTFAQRVAALSEPGGYFNTDNLISNERSFLHVVPALRGLSAQAARNGVYLGVGPDQNFSYIAHLRPAMAILVDIRRDNLLLHLLFKAMFAEARNRVEYLALLTGRPVPQQIAGWEQKPVDAVVAYIDGAKPLEPGALTALGSRLAQKIRAFGVPVTTESVHRRWTFAALQHDGPGTTVRLSVLSRSAPRG